MFVKYFSFMWLNSMPIDIALNNDILELQLPNKKYAQHCIALLLIPLFFSPPLSDLEFSSRHDSIPVEIQD